MHSSICRATLCTFVTNSCRGEPEEASKWIARLQGNVPLSQWARNLGCHSSFFLLVTNISIQEARFIKRCRGQHQAPMALMVVGHDGLAFVKWMDTWASRTACVDTFPAFFGILHKQEITSTSLWLAFRLSLPHGHTCIIPSNIKSLSLCKHKV